MTPWQKILLCLPHIKQYSSILLLLLIVSLKAGAQGSVLNHTYSFSEQTYTIYELATAMKQQADISISYDTHKISSKTKIRLPKQTMTAKELAVLLSNKYGIQSKFIGKHILLQKDSKSIAKKAAKKEKAKSKRQKVLAGQPPKRKQETAPIPAQLPEQSNAVSGEAALDEIVTFDDTFTINSAVIAQYEWNVAPAKEETDGVSKNTERLDRPQVISLSAPWYKKFGLSVQVSGDEIFYFNPGLSLHWGNFAVNGSYAIRGDLSHFRFGLSYTQPLSSNMSLTLWGNYGLVSDQAKTLNYQYDTLVGPLPDSQTVITIPASASYSLNGNMFKAGINLDWKLGSKVALFAGLSFNRSRTEIKYNGAIQAPYTFINNAAVLNARDFNVLPPILSISNDFSPDRAIQNRTWAGLQLGLRFYLFRFKDND